ncbi:MAG: hypothetical protein ACREHE_17360 [Rhizomicrobium sp.]
MPAKSPFRAFGMISPVLYFGGLFYYFFHTAGSVEQAEAMGLGPTLLGLAIVGVVVSIPLLYGLVRLILTRRHAAGGRSGPRDPDDGDSTFDADAMIARYLARQAEEAAANPAPPSPARGGNAPKPASFGRKGR